MVRLRHGKTLFAALLCAPVSAAAPEASPSPATRSIEIGFAADLGLTDARLTRPRQSRDVTFVAEPRWKPVEGSRLQLVLAHSPQLDPGRSFLTVTLNQGLLRSLRLDETNEAETEIVIPIPPALLQRRNELTLSVEQHARGGDDAWTLIRSRSSVALAYVEGGWQADLRDLPLPLLDPAVSRPKRLAVLLPSRVTPATLEATALLLAHLALRSAPQPLRLAFVRSAEEGQEPLLVVGSLIEQPAVRGLLSDAVRVSETAGSLVLATSAGARLDPSMGVLALGTGASGRPTLTVTGNAPEGALRGAWALVAASASVRGRVAVVAGQPPRVARGARQWNGFIPPRPGFRLSEAGFGPLVLRDDAPLRLSLRATPDARFLSFGHSLDLSLRPLPALLEQAEAQVEIAWNDVVVRRLPPAELPRKPPYVVSLRLPGAALRSDNLLSITWRSTSAGGATGPLLALDPEASELYLPRVYEARLPDFGLLRSAFYPFSLHSDLSDVILVIPERITEELFVLACEAAAHLGRLLPTDMVGFRVRQPSTLTKAERSSAHLLLLRADPDPDTFDAAFPEWRGRREAAGALAVLQEAESPWSRGRYLLSLRGDSAAALLRAFRSLVERMPRERLRGDTAFVHPNGTEYVTLGTPRLVREADDLLRVQAWLRSHWLALPLVLAIVSGLLFLALRLALAHRKGDAGRTGHFTASRGPSRPS